MPMTEAQFLEHTDKEFESIASELDAALDKATDETWQATRSDNGWTTAQVLEHICRAVMPCESAVAEALAKAEGGDGSVEGGSWRLSISARRDPSPAARTTVRASVRGVRAGWGKKPKLRREATPQLNRHDPPSVGFTRFLPAIFRWLYAKRVPVPDALEIKERIEKDAALDHWLACKTLMRSQFEQAKGKRIARARFRNPIVPLVKISVADYFAIQVEHIRHHAEQIQARVPVTKCEQPPSSPQTP